MGSELLVWDRKGRIALSLFISKDYISQSQKERVIAFHREHRPALSLALSLLEGKDYILIYRFDNDYVDYLHIFPELDFEEKVLKRCLIDEDGPGEEDPVLFRIRRKRGRKAEE